MKINLITGGSGFVGGYLVKRLLESGENVWVVMRPLDGISIRERSVKMFSDYLIKFPNTLRIIEGDVVMKNLGINPVYLQELLKGNIFFWHLAANLSFASEDKERVVCTNYIGTINTVNLVNKIANKFIYVSTAYVCGDTKSMFHEKDLDVGQKFRNHYESSKFEAEKYVRNNCKVPYLIFRPSMIMGDAYEGKAEGCTFGYYRFAYMFFIFKNWLIKKMLSGSFFIKIILKFLGTKYDKQNNILIVPWLVLPYTPHGTVDMISVDYVVESMLKGVNKIPHNGQTIHLTNPNPPTFKWVLVCLLNDLGYQKVKFLKISPIILIMSLKILYHTFFPLRVKTRSAMWYLPYITRRYYFSQNNNQIIGLSEPPQITGDFLRKINTYAQKEIFSKINME